MTQPPEPPIPATASPSEVVRRRVRELREGRGWSAQRLAEECAEAGLPELTRSLIANIESGRRSSVTLEEAFALAYALDVAPVYLFLPVDATWVEITPARAIGAGVAREWVRGRVPLPGQDAREYWARRPEHEWDAETVRVRPDEHGRPVFSAGAKGMPSDALDAALAAGEELGRAEPEGR